MKIKTRVKRINDKIDKLMLELSNIRKGCPHPDELLLRTPHCGGEMDNEYSYTFHCLDCGERWREDANFENGKRGRAK